jgi:hypothetical protein
MPLWDATACRPQKTWHASRLSRPMCSRQCAGGHPLALFVAQRPSSHTETLRQASPHCTDKDDWYNGFFLPKGSTIIHNSWAIEHNPCVLSAWQRSLTICHSEIFPDPETLIPERWLKEDGSFDDKVPSQAFGIGRRVCLGARCECSCCDCPLTRSTVSPKTL